MTSKLPKTLARPLAPKVKSAKDIDADDDDLSLLRPFDCGEWYWNDVEGCLMFLQSEAIPKREETEVYVPQTVPMTDYTFREIDVVEQMRFKKRYQRKLKPNEPDVVTLQDVKDLALYMAPLSMMSAKLINVLHVPTTERYLRALILYCHYYLQIGQEMAERVKESQFKIRTARSDEIEDTFRQNLIDLRRLVAKEYSNFLCGIGDTKMFHHMGKDKGKSLSQKDARFIETFTLMCTQIVWLALGRRSFNQLELEINRLTKADIYNSVEHRLKTGYYSSLTQRERSVLFGHCGEKNQKLVARSPLMTELLCKRKRPVDYRLMGLGNVEYEYLPERLRYLLLAITGPEEALVPFHVTVGILGKPRSNFDPALNLLDLNIIAAGKASTSSASSRTTGTSKRSRQSQQGRRSCQKSASSTKDSTKVYGYADIVLPSDEMDSSIKNFPLTFPAANAKIRYCSGEQRLKWINRFHRLMNRSDARTCETESGRSHIVLV
ncbi:protein phosphatase 1 inhibitor domain-containing protein [Phthorimaea operculella]|nr:protein phosphatase 1 inhibitor domain-containing protein [Phthorimaea operculella]